MAFKKTLAKRLLNITKISNYRISSSVRSPNPSKPGIAPDPGDNGIFRRFLHKRPVFLSELRQPSANTILPRLREMDIARSRIRLDGLTPPEKLKLAPNDMRKLLRHVRLEAVKSKLRDIPQSCITYSEFFRICDEICSDPEEARSIAQMLEDSSSVMIFGDVVHLRPEKVAEIFHSVFSLRESEREEMEKVKAEIDERAKTLTQRELWAGYGLILAQIIGSMRLTFWELSWDVMEPICYFVSCIYFMVGYTFFLRTSNQPCYNGIYESRFNSQQKRLMKLYNFDIARYNELKGVVVPSQFHKKIAVSVLLKYHSFLILHQLWGSILHPSSIFLNP